jgi:hypothetical protein
MRDGTLHIYMYTYKHKYINLPWATYWLGVTKQCPT